MIHYRPEKAKAMTNEIEEWMICHPWMNYRVVNELPTKSSHKWTLTLDIEAAGPMTGQQCIEFIKYMKNSPQTYNVKKIRKTWKF